MSKETRFCPFMRKLTREHWRTAQDRVAAWLHSRRDEETYDWYRKFI